jgi:acyl-CoA synthetase (AMP-forming)/AMP-acid ligase II
VGIDYPEGLLNPRPSEAEPDTGCLVNVARFLPEAAARHPNKPALIAPVASLWSKHVRYDIMTFAELDLHCNRMARHFRAQGLSAGQRALVMVRPGTDLIVCAFTLFKLGVVPVLIDPGMGLRSFLRCVERSRPDILLGIPLAHRVSRIFRKYFTSVTHRIVVGNSMYRKAWEDASGDHLPAIQENTTANTLAAILFTSGSTGVPKGVCYEHGMFEAQIRLLKQVYAFGEGEVDLPMLPIFALFNPALGMTTVVPRMNPSRPATVKPRRIVEAMQQWQVSNSFGSPVLWGKIARYCNTRGITLPSVQRILIAGAPVSPQVLRQLKQVIPNGEIYTPYGATECLPVSHNSATEILQNTWQQTEKGCGTCVGKLFPGMEVAILSIQDGGREVFTRQERLSDGEIGEILVSGPVMTRQYDGLPEETANSKSVEEETGRLWHRIGDVGYRDEEGRLWFCGRKVERVELGNGETLYTDCVEAVFNCHPEVYRTALIALKDSQGVVIPALVIEPEKGCWPSNESARQRLTSELRRLGEPFPHTKKIQTFFFCRHFPVDVRHNAKIHRLTLSKRYQKDWV